MTTTFDDVLKLFEEDLVFIYGQGVHKVWKYSKATAEFVIFDGQREIERLSVLAKVPPVVRDAFDRKKKMWMGESRECPDCHGLRTDCETCHGAGTIVDERTYDELLAESWRFRPRQGECSVCGKKAKDVDWFALCGDTPRPGDHRGGCRRNICDECGSQAKNNDSGASYCHNCVGKHARHYESEGFK